VNKSIKIFVAGHRGLVGSALMRCLQSNGYVNLITRARQELELLDQTAVFEFLREQKPDFIFIAAAKVGGIQANNTCRADFIYQNLVIQANLIHGAHLADVQRLMFPASSCVYPRNCPQPMKEESLLTGLLEPTNEPYAVAKIAGLKLCEAYNQQYGRKYITVMPTNIYGPNDNYDLENSHVLPALIRKTHEAKEKNSKQLLVWGSGTSRREFLYVDDLADACVFLMEQEYDGPMLNIGTGNDITIKELAETIMQVIGFKGEITFDSGKPDGMPRKLLDITKLKALGWMAKTSLEEGISKSYRHYLSSLRRK